LSGGALDMYFQQIQITAQPAYIGERFKKGFAMSKTKCTPFKAFPVKWTTFYKYKNTGK
jgi:hypothetical protein